MNIKKVKTQDKSQISPYKSLYLKEEAKVMKNYQKELVSDADLSENEVI